MRGMRNMGGNLGPEMGLGAFRASTDGWTGLRRATEAFKGVLKGKFSGVMGWGKHPISDGVNTPGGICG
jgi:hypothetical protein